MKLKKQKERKRFVSLTNKTSNNDILFQNTFCPENGQKTECSRTGEKPRLRTKNRKLAAIANNFVFFTMRKQ